MLDEKGTAGALKEAYGKGGYRFALSSGILSVRAEGWGVRGYLEKIPAKVLGLIAEHFGAFPEDGDCYELRKDQAEQSVMFDQEASWWDQIRGLLDGDCTGIQQTPLLLNGFEIWQEQRQLKTRMVDPKRTRIIDSEYRQTAAASDSRDGTLLWSSMGGTFAYVMAETPEEGRLDRLDGWPWCGGDLE